MTHDENNKDQVILSQREVIQALKAKAERLEKVVGAMTETAAEQSRVYIEQHNDLMVQDELIRTQGKQIKDYLDSTVKADVERDSLRTELAEVQKNYCLESLQTVLDLRTQVRELAEALEELAPCDYNHGWAEDCHSESCRKCAALSRIKRPDISE